MIRAENILAAIEAIAATNSRSEKESMLSLIIGDELTQRVLKATYDPFVTYGLTPERIAGDGVCELSDGYVWFTLDALAARRLTGNAARDAVAAIMKSATPATAELLWRILSKDMRAGFTANTVNKVMPGLIPEFSCQLSKPYEAKRVKKWPVWVEPKLDGLRTICMVQNGEAKFLSRTGKEFDALAPLKPHVEVWMQAIGQSDVVIEGEAISGGFAETSGAVRRKSELATTTEFHVFDILPLATFVSGARSEPFYRRRAYLVGCFDSLALIGMKDSPIKLVPGSNANSHEEIIAIYERHRDTKLADYLGRDHAELGDKVLEGAMVKLIDAPYELKRSWSWMKCKASETEDLRVIDAFEGEGKYAHLLGGLIVERPFKGGMVQVRVGSGFSDELRHTLWAQYLTDKKYPGVKPDEELIGSMIEVEFHEATTDGSLRHPRFVRFRNDKNRREAA